MHFKAVLFDLIGTTVKETNSDIITICLEKAFRHYGVSVDIAFLRKSRGKDKKLMIAEVLDHHNFPITLKEPIYSSFKKNFSDTLGEFSVNEGANELFLFLKNKNIKTGLGTGLSRDLFEELFHHLGWNDQQFDYIGIADETGASRPQPDMIFDMMTKLKITNKKEILKVGDTIADIQEGKNAGVFTAVIISGTQDKNDLVKQKPDFVIYSLNQLREIID